MNAFRLAAERHGHTPLMHSRVDARTHAKHQADLAEMTRFIQSGGNSQVLSKPEQTKTPGGKPIQARKPMGLAQQSRKNRLAGRPEMPDSFESGQMADWSSPGAGTSDTIGYGSE